MSDDGKAEAAVSDRIDRIRAEERMGYTPDWRWLQAGQVALGRTRPRDDLVRDVAAYRKVRNGPGMREELRRYEAVEQMYRATEPHAFRWYVEALLIAGATDEEIAACMGLPPGFIKLYHDVCYEVRPYRECPGLLQSAALQRLSCVMTYDTVWKRIGLACGKEALYACWGGAGSDAVHDRLDRLLIDNTRRAAVAASEIRRPQVGPHDASKVIEQYARMAASDTKAAKGAGFGPLPQIGLRPMEPTDEAVEPIRLPDPSTMQALLQRMRGGSSRSSA